MKTNHTARWMASVRRLMLGLALAGMVGSTFWLGECLTVRFGQPTARQTEELPAPNVKLGDLVAAVRS